MMTRQEYLAAYPYYCRKCEGWGVHKRFLMTSLSGKRHLRPAPTCRYASDTFICGRVTIYFWRPFAHEDP